MCFPIFYAKNRSTQALLQTRLSLMFAGHIHAGAITRYAQVWSVGPTWNILEGFHLYIAHANIIEPLWVATTLRGYMFKQLLRSTVYLFTTENFTINFSTSTEGSYSKIIHRNKFFFLQQLVHRLNSGWFTRLCVEWDSNSWRLVSWAEATPTKSHSLEQSFTCINLSEKRMGRKFLQPYEYRRDDVIHLCLIRMNTLRSQQMLCRYWGETLKLNSWWWWFVSKYCCLWLGLGITRNARTFSTIVTQQKLKILSNSDVCVFHYVLLSNSIKSIVSNT